MSDASSPGLSGSSGASSLLSSCSFSSLGLDERLCERVARIGYEWPTEIQEAFIPQALDSRDIIGQARTGTGKTAAFLLPMLHRLVLNGEGAGLVVAPTREIAIQTHTEAQRLAKNLGRVKLALIYGGDPIGPQMRKLNDGAQLIVGTPGRLLDVGRRGPLRFRDLKILVLDEADRMFDLGFREDLIDILKQCRSRESTWLLSATMPSPVIRMTKRFLKDPVQLLISEDVLTVDEVEQVYYSVSQRRKQAMFFEWLKRTDPERAIVFTRTKAKADRLNTVMRDRGFTAAKIHGNMPQDRRTRVFMRMKAGKIRLLVATNVAARGLDIQDVSHIVNFDMPDEAEDYVHRIGRTARMGATGQAVSFVTPEQGEMLTAIEILTNTPIERHTMSDFDTGLEPLPDAPADPSKADKPAPRRERPRVAFGEGLL